MFNPQIGRHNCLIVKQTCIRYTIRDYHLVTTGYKGHIFDISNVVLDKSKTKHGMKFHKNKINYNTGSIR